MTPRWVIAAAVGVVIAVGVAMAATDRFASAGASGPAGATSAVASATSTVTRQDLTSQTEVPAALGYAGAYTIDIPGGASPQQVTQARQTVTENQQALSSDEQAVSGTVAVDDQQVAAAQTGLEAISATLSSDRAKQAQDCVRFGASTGSCSQDRQDVRQDQSALTQAAQQVTGAQASAANSENQAQAKVAADQVKLQGDQATLGSLESVELNPGTTYTWIPSVGAVITEDQPLYSVNDQPVPLLYGALPAYRAFAMGMTGGPDVGELTHDLIALGYGAGLNPSDDFSAVTGEAVQRWQRALGLPATGEILLGQVVFEPGPIRVTSLAASVGATVGGESGSGGGGGGTVLSATSTARQVSISLDTSQQSEVAVGDQVTITLPDEQTTPGVISSVGAVATAPASGSSDSSPTVTVLVKPTDPAATGTWDQAPVNVTITTGSVKHALVVPVDALLAPSPSTYAVQVLGAGGSYRLITVSLGLFDDAAGLVQVKGPDLAAGQRIVVPAP